ncbi:MAG: pitrilysin family protein [Acutalibacteraceae bacterium]|nr:pitrilysin family protein [Acutalibacteraceae bacterium]
MNNITEIKCTITGDKYYKINHKSGLTIYTYPKEGFKSTYAIFGAKYGSINTTFKKDNGEQIVVPDGIAHYLEHKLFESEDGDAFVKYAKTGASANAYTSFDKTCYLFSCADNFEESLKILLEFVQDPYFTEETVQKEQGIIGQEIRMYDDDPNWRVMFNLLGAMYHTHPVKIDIAGTVESIAEITPQKLYDCYNGFYNLHNMALVVVGGRATTDLVVEMADKYLNDSPAKDVTSTFPSEDDSVVTDYVEQRFPVSVPMFHLGFKEAVDKERLTNKEMAESAILLFAVASGSSELYQILEDKGLINNSFDYEHFEGPYYSSVFFGGESTNPKEAARIIREYIDNLRKTGISQADFDIAKKAVYGEGVSSLNRNETIANIIIDSDFSGREIFSYIEDVKATTLEDVNKRLLKQLDSTKSSLSVILPLE